MFRKFDWLVLVLAVLLSACGGSASQANSNTAPMQDNGGDTMTEDEAMMANTPTAMMVVTPTAIIDDEDAMMEKTPETMMQETPAGDAMMETPEFFVTSLADATTGESFRILDFQGKVVLLETMAMWCPNCLRQQKEVMALHAKLGDREDFVSLGLDVDPNERLEDLADYIARNGFDWRYAIAPAEVAREIGLLYGDQFLNPSSTPMMVIDRHGAVHPLPFGIKSAEDLQQALEPFFNE